MRLDLRARFNSSALSSIAGEREDRGWIGREEEEEKKGARAGPTARQEEEPERRAELRSLCR